MARFQNFFSNSAISFFLRMLVVTMCTANPARAAGVDDRLGSLAVGRQADISVLDIRPGDWMVYDVLGAGLRVDRAVVPFVTVKKGRVFTPDWGPRAD